MEMQERVFKLTVEETRQVHEWMEAHNRTCPLPTIYRGFIYSSKYRYEIRESSIGILIIVYCDCGDKFEPDSDL